MVKCMKSSGLIFLFLFLFLLSPFKADAEGRRTVEVTYTVEVRDIPKDAEDVRVWVPYPLDGWDQRILHMEIEAPVDYEITYDPEWGNRMIYFSPEGLVGFTFKMRFVVERREVLTPYLNDRGIRAYPDPLVFKRFLEPSRYAIHNERVKRLSRMAVGGKTTPIEKARDIYEFVLENMEYNKKVPGWGKGDVNRICLAIGEGGKGTGNCTDFHSFFSSLMQVQNIPVVFEMGFPLKPGVKEAGPIKGGYHCWARFFVPSLGWVPVDISEADKDPSKKEYFFGSICENRVLFSRGRDIRLVPQQKGERLNFFGPDPYIEVDGRPYEGFTRTISYRDVKR